MNNLVGKTFRHKAKGTVYFVSMDNVMIESTWEVGVLYWSLDDGIPIVRSLKEFTDGRFEQVDLTVINV